MSEETDAPVVEEKVRKRRMAANDTEVFKELTSCEEGTGSCRFGYYCRRPDILCMLIGPIPEAYPVMGAKSSKQLMDLARKAQLAAREIYASSKENRPKTFYDLARAVERMLK